MNRVLFVWLLLQFPAAVLVGRMLAGTTAPLDRRDTREERTPRGGDSLRTGRS